VKGDQRRETNDQRTPPRGQRSSSVPLIPMAHDLWKLARSAGRARSPSGPKTATEVGPYPPIVSFIRAIGIKAVETRSSRSRKASSAAREGFTHRVKSDWLLGSVAFESPPTLTDAPDCPSIGASLHSAGCCLFSAGLRRTARRRSCLAHLKRRSNSRPSFPPVSADPSTRAPWARCPRAGRRCASWFCPRRSLRRPQIPPPG